MPDEDKLYVRIGDDPPDEKVISGIWVLVAVHKDGGEGVYGQTIPDTMYADVPLGFMTPLLETKQRLQEILMGQGRIPVAPDGVRMEWRFYNDGETIIEELEL